MNNLRINQEKQPSMESSQYEMPPGQDLKICIIRCYADIKLELGRNTVTHIAKELFTKEKDKDVLEEIVKAGRRRLCVDKLLKRVLLLEPKRLKIFFGLLKWYCPERAQKLVEIKVTEKDRSDVTQVNDAEILVPDRIQSGLKFEQQDVEFFKRQFRDMPEKVDRRLDVLLSQFRISVFAHSEMLQYNDPVKKIITLLHIIQSCHFDSDSEIHSVLGSKLYRKWQNFKDDGSKQGLDNQSFWHHLQERIQTYRSYIDLHFIDLRLHFLSSFDGSLVLKFAIFVNTFWNESNEDLVKTKVLEMIKTVWPEYKDFIKEPVHLAIFFKPSSKTDGAEVHFYLETSAEKKACSCKKLGSHDIQYIVEEMNPTSLSNWMINKHQLIDDIKTKLMDLVSSKDMSRRKKMKKLLSIVESLEKGYELLEKYCEEHDTFVYDVVFKRHGQMIAEENADRAQQTEFSYGKEEGLQRRFCTWIDFTVVPKEIATMPKEHEEQEEEDVYQHKTSAAMIGLDQIQREQIHLKQVKNAFGGWNFQVDDMQRAQRFLITGCERGTYTTTEQNLKRENVRSIDRLISEGKGKELLQLMKEISLEGRAAKPGQILFCLAICARSYNKETKKAAYDCLNEICRIPTHLFMFVRYAEEESSGTGWGRAHRRAINKWYEELAERKPMALAILVTKYKKREDDLHKDLLRLSHIKPKNDCLKVIITFVIKGFEEAKKLQEDLGNDENLQKLIVFLEATEQAKKCTDEKMMTQLIGEHNLVREHVPTALLKSRAVWEALLKKMPMTAMIRNLAKMTSLELLYDGSEYEKAIVERLNDAEALKAARVHPFNVLVALNQYKKGHGDKGHLIWSPNENVMDALDSAYYLSFKAVEPTGKRYLLAIDVSVSMNVLYMGTHIFTCREAAAAMMMVTLRTEENCEVVAFSHELRNVPITKEDNLNEVINTLSYMPSGVTDCALPMLYAMDKQKEIDVFIVYTGNETFYGKVHPFKAIQDYRLKSKIFNAKLIVVSMASNGFTIADPDDPNMLDIVGFDSGAIEVMNNFIIEKV